jgi:hypothetical protein
MKMKSYVFFLILNVCFSFGVVLQKETTAEAVKAAEEAALPTESAKTDNGDNKMES